MRPAVATRSLTWDALVARAPALADLQRDVAAVRDEGGHSFCANRTWYVHFAPRLAALAGPQSGTTDSVLRTRQAHDVAYQHLLTLLPDCRNCICQPW